jgi:hypothetical protein
MLYSIQFPKSFFPLYPRHYDPCFSPSCSQGPELSTYQPQGILRKCIHFPKSFLPLYRTLTWLPLFVSIRPQVHFLTWVRVEPRAFSVNLIGTLDRSDSRVHILFTDGDFLFMIAILIDFMVIWINVFIDAWCVSSEDDVLENWNDGACVDAVAMRSDVFAAWCQLYVTYGAQKNVPVLYFQDFFTNIFVIVGQLSL